MRVRPTSAEAHGSQDQSSVKEEGEMAVGQALNNGHDCVDKNVKEVWIDICS